MHQILNVCCVYVIISQVGLMTKFVCVRGVATLQGHFLFFFKGL